MGSEQIQTWLKLVFLMIICSASRSNAINTTRHPPVATSNVRVFHDVSMKAETFSSPEDVTMLSERDLTPDILATPMPVTAISPILQAFVHPKREGLQLRSSSRNISGIGGHAFFALPIFRAELMEILNKAQSDLSSRNQKKFTTSYEVKTTKWSFLVITANRPLQYGTIRNVVARLLKLSSPTTSSNEIVSTRVGVLFNGSIPIANINILPFRIIKNSSYVPFSRLENNQSLPASEPIEIMKITPFESSCTYEIVDESSALAPFQNWDLNEHLRTRQIAGEILAHVGQTAFAMTVHLWRRPDGLPVETKILALKAVVYIGYWQIMAAAILTTFEVGFLGMDDLTGRFLNNMLGLDTGFYVIGRMIARFIVRIISAVGDPKHGMLTLQTWKEILEVLLNPLQEMVAYDNGWAMEGAILSPKGNTTLNSTMLHGERDVIAEWRIWIGDYDSIYN